MVKQAKQFKPGDRVEWKAGSGTTTGEIQKQVKQPTTVEGHKVDATEDDPRYLVKNDSTGAVTGHRPETLHKISKSQSSPSKSSSKSDTSKSSASKSNRSRSNASKSSASKSDGSGSSINQSSDESSDQQPDQDALNAAFQDFKKAVNMTAKGIERWLQTEESQSVGQDSGDGESKGRKSGRYIIELLNKKKSDYDSDDIQQMKRVVSYVHRHSAQRPSGDIEDTNWRYSLMNWGHDPLKS